MTGAERRLESAEIDRRMELLMTQTDGVKKGETQKEGVRPQKMADSGRAYCLWGCCI